VTEQFGRISTSILDGGDWDLFLTVFGGAHRGGHYLWNLSQIERNSLAPETLRALESSREEIYQACDRELGRLLAAAPGNARILAFALHGMGPNPGWADYFFRMVAQIQGAGSGERARPGLTYRLKKALPWKLVRQVTTRLPASLNQALVPLWSRRMCDWRRTRYFPVPLDINGYLRINLKGREPFGIVEPGAEYDELCSELAAAFLSFKDIDTGAPVVAAVDKVADMAAAGSACRPLLPDLVVRWAPGSALESRGIRSDRYGELCWERGARLASGRAGNHLNHGWYVAAGEGIAPGACDRTHDIVDLLPTVFHWLGAKLPDEFEGSPIPELAGGAPAATETRPRT
jgi:predicted AlkP superfamily phosphohydrolase/phosphomutase